MQFHFYANQSHFHKNGFALTLALKQRHKRTRNWKWPITQSIDQCDRRTDKTTHSTGCGLVFTKIPRALILKMTVESNEKLSNSKSRFVLNSHHSQSLSVVLLPPIDALDVRRFINFISIATSKFHKGLIIQKKITPYVNLSTH